MLGTAYSIDVTLFKDFQSVNVVLQTRFQKYQENLLKHTCQHLEIRNYHIFSTALTLPSPPLPADQSFPSQTHGRIQWTLKTWGRGCTALCSEIHEPWKKELENTNLCLKYYFKTGIFTG